MESHNEELAKEKYDGILSKIEKKFVYRAVPFVPKWCETYHLTLMTIIWSLLMLFGGYVWYYTGNSNRGWVSIALLVVQKITDLLDGSVGRARDTGLVKRGFYMDHILDFIFMISLFVSIFLISPIASYIRIGLLFGAALVGFLHVFVFHSACGKLEIAKDGLGPTEMMFILIGLLISIMYLPNIAYGFVLPLISIMSVFMVIRLIYISQGQLRDLDMKNKGK